MEENGKKSSPWQVYNASKVYSEKATWEWVKANNPKFDVTAILPVYCYGPFNHNVRILPAVRNNLLWSMLTLLVWSLFLSA